MTNTALSLHHLSLLLLHLVVLQHQSVHPEVDGEDDAQCSLTSPQVQRENVLTPTQNRPRPNNSFSLSTPTNMSSTLVSSITCSRRSHPPPISRHNSSLLDWPKGSIFIF